MAAIAADHLTDLFQFVSRSGPPSGALNNQSPALLFPRSEIWRSRLRRTASPPPLDVVLYGGVHELEVVGESFYQDALWRAIGSRTQERVSDGNPSSSLRRDG
jgi:hypothetical protein